MPPGGRGQGSANLPLGRYSTPTLMDVDKLVGFLQSDLWSALPEKGRVELEGIAKAVNDA